MINLKKFILFSVFAIALFSGSVSAQCTGCTVQNPSGNYLFLQNSVVCITQNTTLGDVGFQNNVKICISPGVTLTILNNIESISGNKLTLDISGTLQLNQSASFNTNVDMNIMAGGSFLAGTSGNNNLNLNGTVNNIINRGEFNVNVLTFQNVNSNNIIDNFKTLNIGGNINITGNTTFRNSDVMNVGGNYNNNANSLFINCGTTTSSNGFNLNGGRVINTGSFKVLAGSVDMSSGSRLENYGNFYSGGSINGSSTSVFYNEGLASITTIQPNGCTFKGPSSNTKKGYFSIVNAINPNGAKIGPNLDFKKCSSLMPEIVDVSQGSTVIFQNEPIYINAFGTAGTAASRNVTFACSTCTAALLSSYSSCPNLDGTFSTAQVCVKPGLMTSDPRVPTKMGITIQQKQDAWPLNIPNGFLALESKGKGFVITRVAHVNSTPSPSDSVTDPKEGMIVYDLQDKCMKLYNGTLWNCIIKSCNVVIP